MPLASHFISLTVVFLLDHLTCPPITPAPHTPSLLPEPLITQSEGVSPPIPAASLQVELAQASAKRVSLLQHDKDNIPSNAKAERVMIPAQAECVAVEVPSSAPPTEHLVHTSAMRQREVQHEIHTLKGMYDHLLMKTVESFKEKYMETPAFLSRLRTSIAILPSSLKEEHIHFLHEKSSEIAKATSVDELFIIVNCYSDFLNCSLVVHVIERFGDDQLREDLQNYTVELESFRFRTNLSDFIAAHTGRQEIPRNFLKLVLKMGPQWELCTLKDLEEFCKTLKGRSFLTSYAFRFIGGETGSIFLIWSVPRTCNDALVSSLDRHFLQQCNIEEVTIDGEDLENYRRRRHHYLPNLDAVSSKVNATLYCSTT